MWFKRCLHVCKNRGPLGSRLSVCPYSSNDVEEEFSEVGMTSSVATRSSLILSRIRSLTARKTAKRSSSEPSTREGSSKDQCSLLAAPGKNGHASFTASQTVIT